MKNQEKNAQIGLAVRGIAKAKQLLTLGLISMASLGAIAQNTSYNANTTPISGVDNAAFGSLTLGALTTGSSNVGIGKRALKLNTSGNENVGVGVNALGSNTTNSGSTAVGHRALETSTEVFNTAIGHYAMQLNTSGKNNSSLGAKSLQNNTQGAQNTAIGASTMLTNTTGSNLTTLGFSANVSAANQSNSTALGALSVVNANNKVRIGNTTVTVIEGQVAYTWPSDARFKFNITEEVQGLDFITKLRPVTYNFDTRKFEEFLTKNMPEDQRAAYLQADFAPSTAIRQSGFLAQEVEQAAKAVGYDFNGVHVPTDASDNYSLAYAEFVVPLVKAVQEQQSLIQDQNKTITTQQQQLDALQKQVALLAATQSDASKVTAVNGVKMYPNPSEGMITINTPAMEAATVEVYDMSGARVYQSALKGATSTHQIDLSAYPRGMYSVKVMASGQEVSSQKIVLQ